MLGIVTEQIIIINYVCTKLLHNPLVLNRLEKNNICRMTLTIFFIISALDFDIITILACAHTVEALILPTNRFLIRMQLIWPGSDKQDSQHYASQ